MAIQYIQLNYEEYGNLERQMLNVRNIETTHTSVKGFYHKAIRLEICKDLIIEFIGPVVPAGFPEVK